MIRPTPHQAGAFLWQGSLSERLAVGTLHRLERGPLLRDLVDAGLLEDADRRRASQFAVEETRHGDLLRACARQYFRARPELGYGAPAWTTEAVGLATLAFAEQFATPGFPAAMETFAWLGDTQTLEAYAVIVPEEAGHVAWGKRVLAAIRHAGGQDAVDVRAFFRSRQVRDACKAMTREHPWLQQPRRSRP